MKKTILILAGLVCIAAWAGTISFGWGKVITATTDETVLQIGFSATDYATKVSILNTGTGTLFVAKNCTTNSFVLTNAIPIAVDAYYTFEMGDDIKTICYATSAGTATFHISAE